MNDPETPPPSPAPSDDTERLRRALGEAERRLIALEEEHAALLDHVERGLPARLTRLCRPLGKGTDKSFLEHRQETLRGAEPTRWHPGWAWAPRTFLMICHDQGLDRRVVQQAQALQARGWRGVLVCRSWSDEDVLEEVDGLLVHRVGARHEVPDCPHFWRYQDSLRVVEWWGRARRFLRHQSYLRYWKRLEQTYVNTHINYPLPFDAMFAAAGSKYAASVVIAHDLPALPAAVRLSRSWQVPLVYDAHELYYEQKAFSDHQKRLMRDCEAALIGRCDHVFTVNLSIAEEMSRRYGIARPHVMTNAVDPPPGFDPDAARPRLREALGLTDAHVIVLFQGGVVANRNLEMLVDSFRYVQDERARLVVMGDGALVPALQTAASSLGGRVMFKPAVPQEELLAWTAGADVGVIPYPHVDLNTLWCTPNKLFEFIQAGVPMVANDSPELRRFVHDTGFGIVGRMETAEEMAALLTRMVGDAPLRAGARARLLAERGRYSWAAEAVGYVAVMEGLPLRPPVV